MTDNDLLQRFIFENAAVRGELVHLQKSFQTILSQHSYATPLRKLLGEALAAATLLTSILKFKGRLSVQFRGKGLLKLLLAQCSHEFEIRGLVQWEGEANINEADVLAALQDGVLVIMIDPEEGGQRYQGVVKWEGNSLAESLEGYFRNSEQLPTRVWLAVNEEQAAGLLLQVLPEDETRKDWEHLVHLTSTLTPQELLSLQNETLLYRLYSQEKVRIFTPAEVKFGCTCSVTRSENAIKLLGADEIEEELKNNKMIVVTCEFCNKQYSFDRVDIAALFKQGSAPPSSQVH